MREGKSFLVIGHVSAQARVSTKDHQHTRTWCQWTHLTRVRVTRS